MLKKNFLILLVVTSAFAQADVQDTNVGNNIDDLLAELHKLVDQAIAAAEKSLDWAKSKLNEYADKAEGAVKSALQGVVNKVEAEIDVLKNKAKAAGINIDDCLEGNEQALLALPGKLSAEAIHCVTGLVNQGISSIQDALVQVKKVESEVIEITKEVQVCRKSTSQVACLAKLIPRVENDITTLPKQIATDVSSVVSLVEQLGPKIEACAADKVAECGAEAKKIFGKISTCVAGKLHH